MSVAFTWGYLEMTDGIDQPILLSMVMFCSSGWFGILTVVPDLTMGYNGDS